MNKANYPVVVLGLDGATFDLMLPWIETGHLPNLGRLLRGGAWSRLRSTIPPITPCAWSSFMTGKNPGKHGLFDFVEPVSDGHGFRFTNASSRRGQTIWGCLSGHGRRVGVINVPMTFPPERVNGYLISGLDTPHEHANYTYPESLRQQLKRKGIPYRVDLRHLGDMRTDRKRDRRIADLREMESIRTDALKYLRKTQPTDFTMIVYIAVDQVQHHFWHYMDENHDKYDPRGAKRYANVIRDMYVHLDRLVGDVLAELDDDTIVLVMSDHGFGPTRNVRLRLNQALEQHGLLSFAREGRSGRLRRAVGSRLDAMVRLTLTSGMKSLLAGMLPRLRSWFENLDEARIDWSRTLAYANEVYRASPSLWINRKDRATDGAVEGAEQTEKVLREAESVLASLTDPETGQAAISEFFRARDIYSGPYASQAPDLFPSWWKDGFLLDQSRPGSGMDGAVSRSSTSVVGGTEFTGSHRLDGVLIMHGGPVRPGCELTGTEIIDIAPTVLYLMGHPVPDDMDGRVLLDALDPEFVADHPVQYDKTSSAADDRPPPDQPEMSDKDQQLIAKRLQALGYLD